MAVIKKPHFPKKYGRGGISTFESPKRGGISTFEGPKRWSNVKMNKDARSNIYYSSGIVCGARSEKGYVHPSLSHSTSPLLNMNVLALDLPITQISNSFQIVSCYI
jgi:hypothetical protein